ncbi:MAG TPA: PLP-dependent aminotransferase family protein [Chloroflexia bacterium]|nr:PLP-dependent aminotransferase family protein [Chloroflexia bacterium]
MNWQNMVSQTMKKIGSSDVAEMFRITAHPDLISLAFGLPDPALFPIEDYQAATEAVLTRHGQQALQYNTTEGLPYLRELLVERLGAEGVSCPAGIENVVLTTGSQQALDLLGRLLLDPGDTVIVEAPTYMAALGAFDLMQPRYEAIEMDANGLRIDLLTEKLAELKSQGRRVKFLYTIPNFHNPAGVTMSLERRRQLIALAEQENFLIIEDDPYGRLRYQGTSLPSLKSLDQSEHVIMLRTFSKTLAPGLRTGYVVGNARLLSSLAALKGAVDLCSPAFNQYIVAHLLASGAMEAYLAKAITTYQIKESAMHQALEEFMQPLGAEWNRPEGGMFYWLRLPEKLDSAELFGAALEQGIAYMNGASFYPGRKGGHNCMRLNFTQHSPERLKEGLARLAQVVEQKLAENLVAATK